MSKRKADSKEYLDHEKKKARAQAKLTKEIAAAVDAGTLEVETDGNEMYLKVPGVKDERKAPGVV